MKRYLLLLLLLPFTIRIAAQVGEYRNVWAVGVNGGYALDKITFNPTIKLTWHQGISGGVTVRYTSERYLGLICALQCELNYTMMGWKEVIETSTDTYQRNIGYVQLPILAHLGLGKEYGGVKGFLILGPQLGFAMNDKAIKGGEWNEPIHRPNNITQQYELDIERKFDYGITGGAGIEVSTRNGHHFILDARYYFGLSDIFHNSKKDTFGRSAHSAIIAKASYLLDVNRKKSKKK